ncbi:hypothetical protein AALC25_15470 [Lachnospiraceae bacterium 29-84]
MKYRAKTKAGEGHPYPIWVEGRYTTGPAPRPGSREGRPEGHYIDKGGYPGADVYEIDIKTLCRGSGMEDLAGRTVFEDDFVRYAHLSQEGEVIYSYFVAVIGTGGGLEIVDFMTGEVICQPGGDRLEVIGNVFDNASFMEDMGRAYEASGRRFMPYIPVINVQHGDYPYWRLECRECGRKAFGAVFTTRCNGCGGFMDCALATEIKKESISG